MSRGLSVTILGADGSYAGPGGACTGYLVRSPGAAVWLDTGPGTAANLQRHIAFDELTAVVLTHEHPDHWVELPTVYNAIRYYVDRPPLPVYGTAGTRALCEQFSHPLELGLAWTVISDGAHFEIGDQKWTASRTDHHVETLACRVDAAGRSFAFTADTGPGWSLAKLGEGIHLALSEATFTREWEPAGIQHLSARQAGAAAAAAGVERLVITHLMPGSDPEAHLREAAEAFGRPVELATVGAHFDI